MARPKIFEILDLSVAERIELVHEIWDSIAEIPKGLDLTAAEVRDSDARASELRNNPSSGELWEEIKAQLRLSSKKMLQSPL